MVTRRNFTLAATAAALTAAAPVLAAHASVELSADAATSNRPVTIIVPFAKNGTTDQVARLIAEPLAKALGSPVNVKNITGDWGATGSVIAATSAADGHTLIMGQTATHVMTARQGISKRYNAQKDFAAVGLVGISPITFVVRNSMPVQDLADLEAYLKVNQDSLSIAHGGHGTPSYIGARKLKSALGAESLNEKTYASTMAAMEDLATGQADIMATSLPQALPFIKAGKVKALGLASTSRNIALPETFTGTQQGYADLRASHWNGLFAPAGLKPEIQAKLASALAKALADPSAHRKMRDLGIHVPFVEQQGPQALAELQTRELADLTVTA